MKYISWIALGVMTLIGVTVSIYFSTQPKPIAKISFSHFVDSQEIAWALNQRLRLEIEQTDLLYLGVDPQKLNHMEIWKSFLENLKKEGHGFDIVIVDPHLNHKATLAYQEEIDLQQEQARFVEGIGKAKNLHQRVAVVMPNLFTTYLIEQSPASLILKENQIRGLAFTLTGFPRNRNEERVMPYPCVTEQEDRQGTRNLGCMILSQARLVYRKKHVEGKRAGMAMQVGLSEYLVLFN